MKKLLSMSAVIGLSATATVPVVSCSTHKTDNNKPETKKPTMESTFELTNDRDISVKAQNIEMVLLLLTLIVN